MARALDQEKRREWAKRFERFRASGATVTHFCRHERVNVKTFYYWSKRVGSAAPLEQRHAVGEGGISASAGVKRSRHAARTVTGEPTRRPQPRDSFGFVSAAWKSMFPLAAWTSFVAWPRVRGVLARQVARSTPGAFHEIVLGTRR